MASVTVRRLRPATIAATIAAGGVGLGLLSKVLVGTAAADSGAPPKVFGAGPAFVSLPLESSEVVNHNTKRLRFKLPQREANVNAKLDEPGYLELMVKRYPDGKQSTHLHTLAPGQKLLFAAAIKGHQWKPNSYPHITLIAGGAGITPLYQLAQGILRNPQDKTAMTLVFGVNSDQDLLLRQEFAQMEKQFPDRFKAVYTVSNPGPNSPYRKGYVTKKLLEEVVPSPEAGNTKVFVCGPPAMEEALVGKRSSPGILEQLGYRRDQIHRF
ncbi:NADH-cytochrome b5 reductase 2-like protein 1 [Colletotrichum chlorophyti]|uniref:NADH-cytochrome b5 reductase 2-like protein 1 n=1 Tax=Colletotrichum chlorophyti TaxID=708187 RepID=A0A1Q8S6F0_9PEZI|nr:NADH-cytochrome b5 reductase 2-like protein 1 [Colletotrichum chlorophyti]